MCGSNENISFEWINNFSTTYLSAICKKHAKQKFGIVVISKSGTTLEPAIGLKIFRDLLIKKVGTSNASKYIVAITDANEGALLRQANDND
jgi:glucose-6-phosphate isomerase